MLDKIYTANIHVAYICVTDYSGLKQLGRWQAASKHWEVSVNIKADCSHGPQGTACVKEEQDRTFKLPSAVLRFGLTDIIKVKLYTGQFFRHEYFLSGT